MRIQDRKPFRIGIIAGGVVALGIGWYLFRPELLFVNSTVNEALPGTVQASSANAGGPMTLASGRFHGVAHATEGTAAILSVDGKHILRLTNFKTSNGPDVRVYLVAADDAKDNATVTKAGFMDIGAMKGNQGDQNYDVPADLDLQKYRAVTLWCRRFSVNFATAPLTGSQSASR